MRHQRGPLARRPWNRRPGNRSLPLAWSHRPLLPETEIGPQVRDERLARLEAVLMIAEEPVSLRKLITAADLADAAEVRHFIEQLRGYYDADQTAFQVEELAGGFQLRTRPVFHPWLTRLRQGTNDLKLTPAALETLAVVAYRQPVTRADVEAVRGVACGEILRQLMDRDLVRIAGRDDSLGRPLLYGTTKAFLQAFGLNSLRDLPTVGELPPPKG